MSDVPARFRSFKRIRRADLRRLADVVLKDHVRFFRVHPRWRRLYGRRRFVIVLAQGAANHFVTGRKGINDFDVWTFWEQNPAGAMFYRKHKSVDFGDDRFGRSKDKPKWVGRRVDVLRRSIRRARGETMFDALVRYLQRPPTTTAKYLAREPIVALRPRLAAVIWAGVSPASGPPKSRRPRSGSRWRNVGSSASR